MLNLRPYQREAIDAISKAWLDGCRTPAVVLPTGSGKTVVFAHLAGRYRAAGLDLDGPPERVLILAHRDELISQAASKLHSIAPELKTGIIAASQNDIHAEIIVASVQTLSRPNRLNQLTHVGLIIVDECHHAAAASYRRILDHFPNALVVGFTATMVRGDGKALGEVWQKVVYTKSILEMIREGYLCDVRGIGVEVQDLNMGSVKKSRGDFQDGSLGKAIEQSMAPSAIVRAISEYVPGESGILFAPTVHSATILRDALSMGGITAGIIHGGTPKEERRKTLAAFAAGDIQYLCNCMVLTEGFDSPRASVCVIARPTLNPGLYIQMVGRILRTHHSKSIATVLDVVGVGSRHSLATLIDLVGDERGNRKPREGESLTQMMERKEDAPEIEYIDGPIVARPIDLFGTSKHQWLQTNAGNWFVQSSNSYVVIVPSDTPGMWDVCRLDQSGRGGEFIHTNIDHLGYAMGWAEQSLPVEIGTLSSKGARWRKASPTESQITLARRWGIKFDENEITKGELANLMTIHSASARIDRTQIGKRVLRITA